MLHFGGKTINYPLLPEQQYAHIQVFLSKKGVAFILAAYKLTKRNKVKMTNRCVSCCCFPKEEDIKSWKEMVDKVMIKTF